MSTFLNRFNQPIYKTFLSIPKLGFLATLALVTAFTSTPFSVAVAQTKPACIAPEYLQRNAVNVYLIRLTQVGHAPMSGAEYPSARIDTRGARFEVLKVYQGDVDAVKDVENAMIEIQCNNQTGLSCSVLEERNYPFVAGQQFIIYDTPVDGLLTLKMGICPSSRRTINSEEALADFEAYYPAQWESAKWMAEHPELYPATTIITPLVIEETTDEEGVESEQKTEEIKAD